MFIRCIYLFVYILLLIPASLADDDLSVEIKNPTQEIIGYSNHQKALMHINFAKVYGMNNDWDNYYKHISSVYSYCPGLKNSKFYVIRSSKTNLSSEDIINPEIIKKLNKLGINNIFTKADSINTLELIVPVLETKCKN